MKIKLILITIFVTLTCGDLFSQGTATGCLIPSEQAVYPNGGVNILPNGSVIYMATNPNTLSTNYCSWSPSSTASSCTVCDGLGISLGGIVRLCIGTQKTGGSVGTFTMIACPIDDYAWLLPIIVGSSGFFILRKKRLGANQKSKLFFSSG